MFVFMTNTKKHIQVFLGISLLQWLFEIESGKIECLSLIQIMRDNFGDLNINSKLLRVVWLSD